MRRRNRLMIVAIESILLTTVVVLILGHFPVSQPEIKENITEIVFHSTDRVPEIQLIASQKQATSRSLNVRNSIVPVIDYNDLRIKSGATVEQLNCMLKGGLEGLGEYFVEAENKYSVNSLFLISLARNESGNGTYRFMDRNNIFSFGAYDKNPNKAFKFDSLEACIDTVTNYLSEEYLTIGGNHFKGYGLSDVAESYASDKEWEKNIINLIEIELRRLEE